LLLLLLLIIAIYYINSMVFDSEPSIAMRLMANVSVTLTFDPMTLKP